MARGFESKDVEFQQAEAERRKTVRRALSPAESDAITAPYAVREELRTWPHRGDGDGFYAAVLS